VEKVLGPLQALNGTPGELFGASEGQIAAVRIRSNQPVACIGYVSRPSDKSFVAIPALNTATASGTLLFPQLAEGGEWITSIGLINMSSSAALVTLRVCNSDGSLYDSSVIRNNPVTRTLPAWGVFRDGASGLFGFSGADTRQGWIKAEASGPIGGYVEYGAATNRAVVAGQSETFSRGIFSHQAFADPYFTGLAILNPSGLTANVDVLSFRGNGSLIGSTQAVFRPGQHQAFLIHERIPAALGINGGFVFIQSDTAIVATQLFGTSSLTALANVPPQKITTSFDPSQSAPKIRVAPPLAVVETGKTLKFDCAGVGTVEWLVNDVEHGNSVFGTISATGLFTAPPMAPTPRSVTVRAKVSDDRSAGATIDLVQRESFLSGLTVVTCITYLQNLQRFFVAEQTLVSGASSTSRTKADSTLARITEVSPTGQRTNFRDFPGETLGKMIPFTDGAGTTYLLIAGVQSGTIYRLRISDRQVESVINGLRSPKSLALDPVAGNLFVSEQDAGRVTVIPRSRFDPTASAAEFNSRSAGRAARSSQLHIPLASPAGLAFDNCSGALLATSSDGSLYEFRGGMMRIVASGLRLPGEMLILYRDGLTCGDAGNVLVSEATGVSRIFPRTGEKQTFLSTSVPVRDLVFFPKGSPFEESGREFVGIAEAGPEPGGSSVAKVVVAGVYKSTTAAPLGSVTEYSGGTVPHHDPAGDTFGEVSATRGYQLPDLVSADASFIAGRLLVTLTFTGPIAPAGANARNSLYGFVDFDAVAGGIRSHVEDVNPLNPTDMGVDYYIDLSTGTGYDLVEGASAPMQVSFLGNSVTYTYFEEEESPEIQDVIMAVVVGNKLEMTDVAPNTGLIRFRAVQSPTSAKR
jgi:hypothetical protein